MTIVIGASNVRVKCNHAGCPHNVAVKVAKSDAVDARAEAASRGWSIRPDGDYCPDHVADTGRKRRSAS